MTQHPNTARGDVAYWRLGHVQAARYHARLARMYADRSARHAADRFARYATIGNLVVMVLGGISIIAGIISLVVGS